MNEKTIVTKTSGKAIASLILSILWLYGVGSLVAIFLGHSARTDIRNSNGNITGDGLALAGLVIGYVGFIVIALVAIITTLRFNGLI